MYDIPTAILTYNIPKHVYVYINTYKKPIERGSINCQSYTSSLTNETQKTPSAFTCINGLCSGSSI